MDRRSFLKIFSYGLAATVVVPKLSQATSEGLTFPDKSVIPPVTRGPTVEDRDVKYADIFHEAFEEAVTLYKFEANDDTTRNSIRNHVVSKCKYLIDNRSLTEYSVICDLRNNTSETINTGDVYLDVYYKKDMSLLVNRIKFVASSKGVSFSSISKETNVNTTR